MGTLSRWDHTCGIYSVDDTTMLIVTGGGREEPLASTEACHHRHHLPCHLHAHHLPCHLHTHHHHALQVLSYPSDQSWRPVAPLPSPRWGLRVASQSLLSTIKLSSQSSLSTSFSSSLFQSVKLGGTLLVTGGGDASSETDEVDRIFSHQSFLHPAHSFLV